MPFREQYFDHSRHQQQFARGPASCVFSALSLIQIQNFGSILTKIKKKEKKMMEQQKHIPSCCLFRFLVPVKYCAALNVARPFNTSAIHSNVYGRSHVLVYIKSNSNHAHMQAYTQTHKLKLKNILD